MQSPGGGGGGGVGVKVCFPLSHLFYSEPSHLVSLFSIIIAVLSYYRYHIPIPIIIIQSMSCLHKVIRVHVNFVHGGENI